MVNKKMEAILSPYNPWWDNNDSWRADLPDYERPIVGQILDDLSEIKQAISITGPRRVGKSTAVKQVIKELIDSQGVSPERLLYFSFDDPQVFASKKLQHEIFDFLMERVSKSGPEYIFFLDEIQRLPRWELFIKKYYDLKYPVRFVISGSASSPIFRSSQESLLGRIKDHHLLPFSFREFCHYRLRDKKEFSQILSVVPLLRKFMLDGNGQEIVDIVTDLERQLLPFSNEIDKAVLDYCRDGGFPEVWTLSDPIRKIEYLMEQQVRKVLYEDLMMLVKYRKPENIFRFFVYLLSYPGVEINTTKIASNAGIKKKLVSENLPRLEMTDLILRIQKFSHQPLRVRQGNIKCYPIDLALRNAVLKSWEMPDDKTMGLYAENLVVRELMTWQEKIEISYYRERDKEVDFVFTYGGNKHLPIEVKCRKNSSHISALSHFTKKFKTDLGVIITRKKQVRLDKYLYLPLRYFLLVS